MPTRRGLPTFALLLCVAEFLRESWTLHPQLDDAYISYRYAQNLVEGHGLVYNLGERVEGMTNFLWTLLVAAGMRAGWDATAVGHALGLGSGVVVLLATYSYASVGLPNARKSVAAVAPWVVLSATSFVLWSTSGMESPLFVAAVTSALALEARARPGWAATALVVATFTRPEGLILAGILFGFRLLDAEYRAPRRWGSPLAYALALAGLTGFRLVYYGSPIPNTFYAKVGGVPLSNGVWYAALFYMTGRILLLFPASVAGWLDPRMRAGAAWVLVMTGYVIAVGGDLFPEFRFLLPVLPALSALAVHGTSIAWDRNRTLGNIFFVCLPATIAWNVLGAFPTLIVVGLCMPFTIGIAARPPDRRAVAAAALAVLAVGAGAAVIHDVPTTARELASRFSSIPRSEYLERSWKVFEFYEDFGRKQAEILIERGEGEAVVAASAIGVVGFRSRLPIIDLFGLVDPTIARTRTAPPDDATLMPGHQRSNADYVLGRKPAYILIPREGRSDRLPAFTAIWSHPALAAHYDWDDELKGYRRRR